MLRYRRYRVFLVFAVITVFALYKYGGSTATAWQHSSNPADVEQPPAEEKPAGAKEQLQWEPKPEVAQETKKFHADIPAATAQGKNTPPPIPAASKPVDKVVTSSAVLEKTPPVKPTPIGAGGVEDNTPQAGDDELHEVGKGRVEVSPLPSSIPAVHWSKASEKFPIPTKSIMPIPTGKPKKIPKIQFDFKPESATAKQDREAKLNKIKGVFKHSWEGYRKHAWLQDELSPVSGDFRNPFASWGATLVDSLDTLWIMGMKEEFDEAAKAVDEIDFTTSPRPDIPLFETTIRYLGGLIAAYDISGRKYQNLLNKAVELAEVLMSAFDTPNRMPQTYYYWRPMFASQPHRASNRVVLAEIGSLSVEFTRLAQLTGESKYYDAIARITDNLEEFQNKTRLPGMWPTLLDASGCKTIDSAAQEIDPQQFPLDGLSPTKEGSLKDNDPVQGLLEPTEPELSPEGNKYVTLEKPDPIVLAPDERRTDVPTPSASEGTPLKMSNDAASTTDPELSPEGNKYIPLEKPDPIVFAPEEKRTDVPAPSATEEPPVKAGNDAASTTEPELSPEGNKYIPMEKPSDIVFVPESAAKETAASKNLKRQLDDTEGSKVEPTASSGTSSAPSPTATHPECLEQGFASSGNYGAEDYTLGGMSDSTYEYLPKQYLLLGGLVEKYKTMYELSVEVAKKHLIFRPMLPKMEDILFSGALAVASQHPKKTKKGMFEGENAHLTCFAGGMLGMGAKIFDRPEDLDIAKKLTDGCVWSYNVTATGIMPEAFDVIPCDSIKNCEWNETMYWERLDPFADNRKVIYREQMDTYKQQMASASAWYEAELAAMTPAPTAASVIASDAVPTERVEAANLEKRQIGNLEDKPHIPSQVGPFAHSVEAQKGEPEEAEGRPPTKVSEGLATVPSVTMPVFPEIYSPAPPLTHEEYVKNKIKEERLPPGTVQIKSRKYILRPEAIESVWYMYRITGDPYWREAGWKMFLAVNKHTAAEHGGSAIDDVTRSTPTLLDEMESFWLAETLKYFYLLFAEENVVSLDEWVLNTEAHPFRRPT